MQHLAVQSVRHQGGHVLELTFNDGHVQCVDFAPFILSDGHPDYERYALVDEFLRFEIVDGNLNWDDYSMVFPVEDLYRNTLIRRPLRPVDADP